MAARLQWLRVDSWPEEPDNSQSSEVIQNQLQVVEVEKPTVVHKTVQRKKPVVHEEIVVIPKVQGLAEPVLGHLLP